MDWETVDAAIEAKSLLKHPFYRAWSAGTLTLGDLRHYAKQYYALESRFPRLLSRVHSRTEDPKLRRGILENLIDEERGDENHRELWLRFAEGLGLSRDEVLGAAPEPKTLAAVRELEALADDADPSVGLAALYGYESQQPRVSASKIDGLKRFYGIDDARALRFFELHREMDAWHAEAGRAMLESAGADSAKTKAAAGRACAALLTFLDGVDEATRGARGECAAC